MKINRILFVVTSLAELGSTGRKRGLWIEEFAAPYYKFHDLGKEIVIASPKGGQIPIDPRSDLPENKTEATRRYYSDKETQDKLNNSVLLSTVSESDFDTIVYLGGLGPMWDVVDDKGSLKLVESFYNTKERESAGEHRLSELETSMDAVQVEQKSYEMPPRDGFTITLFITVADINRSADFYEKVFGGRILSRGDSKGASGHILIANTWLIVNVGGGPTSDKPTVTLSVLADPDKISSFMNIRVADIQTCYKLWKSRGAEFITEPISKYGEIRCYIRDPDGYIIEVGQSTDLSQDVPQALGDAISEVDGY
jgi:catechol 2,3-dioxygenase-like lactoylglutathione lyase family enzyme